MKKRMVMAFLAMTMVTSQIPALPVVAESGLAQTQTDVENLGGG